MSPRHIVTSSVHPNRIYFSKSQGVEALAISPSLYLVHVPVPRILLSIPAVEVAQGTYCMARSMLSR